VQVEQDRKIKKSEQIEVEESDASSIFVDAVRSQITRDYYLRLLRIFSNHIGLLPGGTMKERCNLFASKGKRIQIGYLVILCRRDYEKTAITISCLETQKNNPRRGTSDQVN
jgi:hypothetical protein